MEPNPPFIDEGVFLPSSSSPSSSGQGQQGGAGASSGSGDRRVGGGGEPWEGASPHYHHHHHHQPGRALLQQQLASDNPVDYYYALEVFSWLPAAGSEGLDEIDDPAARLVYALRSGRLQDDFIAAAAASGYPIVGGIGMRFEEMPRYALASEVVEMAKDAGVILAPPPPPASTPTPGPGSTVVGRGGGGGPGAWEGFVGSEAGARVVVVVSLVVAGLAGLFCL